MHALRKSLSLLIALSALTLPLAGTSAASTATISPAGGVAASAGAWQLNYPSGSLNCTSSSFSVTLPSTVSGSLPLTLSSNLAFQFSRCQTVTGGVTPYTIVCVGAARLNGTGATISGSTPMSVTGLVCTVTISATCSARFSGSVPAVFDNVTNRLTIPTTGQSLTMTGSTCTVLTNGTATITNPLGGAYIYSISAPFQTVVII